MVCQTSQSMQCHRTCCHDCGSLSAPDAQLLVVLLAQPRLQGAQGLSCVRLPILKAADVCPCDGQAPHVAVEDAADAVSKGLPVGCVVTGPVTCEAACTWEG